MIKNFVIWLLSLFCCAALFAKEAKLPEMPLDPTFNFKAIFEKPLDAEVTSHVEENGIMIEEVLYTAEILKGKPVRIHGVLAYPIGGKNLPCILWSRDDMSAATAEWPKVWAAKGYFCLNVTLPHDVYNSYVRFTTERPEDGNLTRLAMVQMRGITYLTQRAEVDGTRIGVAGSSYGGFFASLITGADPRVKCGMSLFTSGEHKLGTGYPQFLALRTTHEVGIWGGTVDPAWRLKRKAVPFLWVIAANDQWAHLPAAIQSYKDSIGDKRMAIVPNWNHALPENVNKEAMDWFDIYLKKSRKPYDNPSPITVANVDGKLIANFSWTGKNRVKTAEVVVAYGRTRPWHDGWLYRYHLTIPAIMKKNTASAEIPVPEAGLQMLVYGNITDDKGVLTTAEPLKVDTSLLQITKIEPLVLNAALAKDFSPEEMSVFAHHGETFAVSPDTREKQAGVQSLCVDGTQQVTMKLGHIPGHSHQLKLWLKAKEPTQITVSVEAVAPAGWQSPIIDVLRRQQSGSPDIKFADLQLPSYSAKFTIDTTWREYTLDCPDDGTPIEGYRMTVVQTGGVGAYWIDTLSFTPQWGS